MEQNKQLTYTIPFSELELKSIKLCVEWFLDHKPVNQETLAGVIKRIDSRIK